MILSNDSVGVLEKDLPYSRMEYPERLADKAKYAFWRFYTPFHPLFRDTALTLGVVAHEGRQRFLIGKIKEGETIKSVVDHLISCGYGNHFIAWKDEGEVVSLRRTVGFEYQYHLRIFKDGEIRGHYEYTPEYKPILHWKAVNQTDVSSEFLRILKDKIIPANQ